MRRLLKISAEHRAGLMFAAFLLLASLLLELLDQLLLAGDLSFFRFDRELILQGQVWRFLSGHFDHLGWTHFFLNAVFLMVLLLVFRLSRSALFYCVLFVMICVQVSLMMLLFSPGLLWYVGLSAGLYGLLSYLLLSDSSYAISLRVLILLGLIVKVVYEVMAQSGQAMSELIGGAVAVDSHLYGVLAGMLLFLLLRVLRI